tara:strand:- start:175 stop:714 length:540 start_codon:yes stop_codon:yes gene_type:complete
MKIISGKFKGRSIKISKGNIFRPTLSRIREDIFNILRHNKFLNVNFEDSVFYDLFCGSGSIGLEALSNGAKKVIFNDIDSLNIQLVKDFLVKTDSDNYEIYNQDAFKDKNLILRETNILYLDPPYQSDIKLIEDNIFPQIPDDCLVIFETNQKFEHRDLILKKEYKNKNLIIFRKINKT